MKKSFPIFTLLAFLLTTSVIAQSPKILVVTAHPDDETGFVSSPKIKTGY
jgi:hypothetical protein